MLHCLAVFPVRVTQIGWNQAENQVPRRDFAWQTTGRGGVISRSLSSPTFIGGEEQYALEHDAVSSHFLFFSSMIIASLEIGNGNWDFSRSLEGGVGTIVATPTFYRLERRIGVEHLRARLSSSSPSIVLLATF